MINSGVYYWCYFMASDFDITFVHGDNYEISIPLWADAAESVPFDYSGYAAKMQVRRKPKAPVLLELSTDNGKLAFVTETIDSKTVNSIRIVIDHADSTALPTGEVGYDLELSNGADFVRTLLRGTIVTEQEYTR